MKTFQKSKNISFDKIQNQLNFNNMKVLQKNNKSNVDNLVNKSKIIKTKKNLLKKLGKKKKYPVSLEKYYSLMLFKYLFVKNFKNSKILGLKKKKALKYRVKHTFVYKYKSRIKFLIRDTLKKKFDSLSMFLENIRYVQLKFIKKNILNFSKRFVVKQKVGFLYIHSKNNNIMCTFVDLKEKKVKISCTLGIIKVEETDLKTDYERANDMGLFICQKIKDLKYTKIFLILNGLSVGRKAIIRCLKHGKFRFVVHKIIDITLSPHNGCRLCKVRRKKFRSQLSFKTVNIVSGI